MDEIYSKYYKRTLEWHKENDLGEQFETMASAATRRGQWGFVVGVYTNSNEDVHSYSIYPTYSSADGERIKWKRN